MSRSKTPTSPAVTQQGWFDRRVTRVVNSNAWLGIAIVMVIALVAGSVYLAVAPKPEPTAVPVEAAPAVVLPTTSATAVAADTDCPPADPVEVAPETLVLTQIQSTWEPVGMMFRPSSASGGPAIAAPFASCFTRTPEGALYAAASFVAEASAAPKNVDRIELVKARAARQGNYDKLVTSLSQDGETVGQPTSRISGYRWIEYSPSAAAVELQFTLITGVQAEQKPTTTAFQVAWEGNDWKVVIPTENGGIHLAGGNLRTFTPWGS